MFVKENNMSTDHLEQILNENKLLKRKLEQVFVDINVAYNFAYEKKINETLTALSVVIMDVGTTLQETKQRKPVNIEHRVT